MRVFRPFLCSLWSLLWKWGGAEAKHSSSCPSSVSLLSQSSPGWKQAWLFILSWQVEHYSWALDQFLTGFSWHWGGFWGEGGSDAPIIRVSSSQKFLIVQQFGVLASLPESVEAEVEVHLNHLFALIGKWDTKRCYSHTEKAEYTILSPQPFPNLNQELWVPKHNHKNTNYNATA